ncbi:hypothetical protein FGIG_05577 [Fasciola gigantica]|uniref:Uncharacterized protein n=1 Tax=Fasciola gigantica TaxID=46835 RepID=A0A504Z1Y1_FASGI|nr:hypothetical protein FGIG_05577 [Fasciola gigantica]
MFTLLGSVVFKDGCRWNSPTIHHRCGLFKVQQSKPPDRTTPSHHPCCIHKQKATRPRARRRDRHARTHNKAAVSRRTGNRTKQSAITIQSTINRQRASCHPDLARTDRTPTESRFNRNSQTVNVGRGEHSEKVHWQAGPSAPGPHNNLMR